MSQKNKLAAKAARRFERETASQNQTSSSRITKCCKESEAEFIKSIAAEKKSFGDFTKEQLIKMPVRITFFSDMLLKDDAILEFETDMDRFLNTVLFCKSKVQENPKTSVAYYSVLMDLFKIDAPFDEYSFTIAMHYLASIPSVEHKLKYGLQPLSFMVFVNDEPNYIDPLVQMSSYDEWMLIREQCINDIINNKNKNNAA